jgi:hypothetical protein
VCSCECVDVRTEDMALAVYSGLEWAMAVSRSLCRATRFRMADHVSSNLRVQKVCVLVCICVSQCACPVQAQLNVGRHLPDGVDPWRDRKREDKVRQADAQEEEAHWSAPNLEQTFIDLGVSAIYITHMGWCCSVSAW